jgi:hypothetical protein
MDSLAFLESDERLALEPLYVLHGDEVFLKLQMLARLSMDST